MPPLGQGHENVPSRFPSRSGSLRFHYTGRGIKVNHGKSGASNSQYGANWLEPVEIAIGVGNEIKKTIQIDTDDDDDSDFEGIGKVRLCDGRSTSGNRTCDAACRARHAEVTDEGGTAAPHLAPHVDRRTLPRIARLRRLEAGARGAVDRWVALGLLKLALNEETGQFFHGADRRV